MRRRDYYAGIVLLGAMLLLGDYGLRVAGAGPDAPATVRPPFYEFVDASGTARANLGIEPPYSPVFTPLDRKGKARLFAYASKDGSLMLTDREGLLGPTFSEVPYTPESPATPKRPVAPSGDARLHEVRSFDGDADRDTHPFTLGGRWRIEWETRPNEGDDAGNFIADIVRGGSGGDLDRLANVTGAHSATSREYEAGTYYLKIRTIQHYTIRVYSE